MAYSYIEYTAGGSATFNIPFEYINQSEIEVFVDGTAATFTFTSANTVNVTPTPTSGATVRIERTTDLTNRAVDFASGSVLTEEDLDNSNIQVYHAAQEAIDKAEAALSLDADGKFDGEVNGSNRVIKNVADPVNAQDVATKNYIENTWLSPSDKAQLNAIDTTKLHTVANDIANVNTTAGSIANVNTVGGAISNVNTVAGSIANVNTTATNIADVNTVATNIGDINTVENSIANVNTTATNIADVNTVATNIGDINTVENSIANVNKVGTDIANVNTTAGSIANVNTVATNVADVNTTAGAIANVNAVGGNIANVNAVAGNATNINAVQANETNINAVNANSGNINTVAGNNTNVTTVANNIADVSLAATNISDIQTIATEVAKVVTVANDLNEATSEIDVVAASIANVDAVGWFDTTGDKMMVYNGGSWQNAGSSVNGTAARFKFVATASQTAFTGADANGATLAYDSGYIDVYLNGVHLDPSDYTATDGSTITLASGAAAGDELYVVAFGTFTLATHYTKTEVDGLLSGIASDAITEGNSSVEVVDTGSGYITATTDGSERMRIDSSGNVVIGGTSAVSIGAGMPSLTLKGTSASYPNRSGGIALDSYNGSYRSFIYHDTDLYIQNTDACNTRFYTNNTERMRIDSSGNVGIGTSSPSATLTVAGGDVRIDTDDKGVIWGNNGIFGNNASDYVYVETQDTERMRIDSAGRVTKPYQPSFRATLASDFTINAGGGATKITGWSTGSSMGSFAGDGSWNNSNSRFTAPVAGKYIFNATSLHNVGSNWRRLYFYVNGSKKAEFLHGGHAYSDSWDHSTGSAILSLNANDYVELYADQQNSGYMYASYTQFDGYLLG